MFGVFILKILFGRLSSAEELYVSITIFFHILKGESNVPRLT